MYPQHAKGMSLQFWFIPIGSLLSRILTTRLHFRKFYLLFNDIQIVNEFVHNLTWTHIRRLLSVTSSEARLWYMTQASKDMWSTTTLDRNICSQYYERRLADQRKRPKEVLPIAKTAIGGIKSATTRFANQKGFEFGWQTGFHDHIILNRREYEYISEDIKTLQIYFVNLLIMRKKIFRHANFPEITYNIGYYRRLFLLNL